jgi:hypothetical protein
VGIGEYAMIYHGHVENGTIILDGTAKLPDGAEVEVHLVTPPSDQTSRQEPPWFKFIGAIKDLPPDASRRIDEVLYGRPEE